MSCVSPNHTLPSNLLAPRWGYTGRAENQRPVHQERDEEIPPEFFLIPKSARPCSPSPDQPCCPLASDRVTKLPAPFQRASDSSSPAHDPTHISPRSESHSRT